MIKLFNRLNFLRYASGLTVIVCVYCTRSRGEAINQNFGSPHLSPHSTEIRVPDLSSQYKSTPNLRCFNATSLSYTGKAQTMVRRRPHAYHVSRLAKAQPGLPIFYSVGLANELFDFLDIRSMLRLAATCSYFYEWADHTPSFRRRVEETRQRRRWFYQQIAFRVIHLKKGYVVGADTRARLHEACMA